LTGAPESIVKPGGACVSCTTYVPNGSWSRHAVPLAFVVTLVEIPFPVMEKTAPASGAGGWALDSLVILMAPTRCVSKNVHVTVWSAPTMMLLRTLPVRFVPGSGVGAGEPGDVTTHAAAVSSQFGGTVSVTL